MLRAVWSSGRASRVLDHETPEVECNIMAKLSPRRPLTCKPKQANHKLLLYYPISFNPILAYPILSYSMTFYPVLASYVRFYPILSHPVLSYPILSSPILSYPYPILSYPILLNPILSYSVLFRPKPPDFTECSSCLSRPLLFYPVLYCPRLSQDSTPM